MSVSIRLENLSKRYILRHQQSGSYVALRDVITEKVKSAGGIVTGKKKYPLKEEFYALRDVSIDIEKGDRVGIIGRNGAGKSTLLKIISRIVEPTSGKVKMKGRVASLLEVGTGFHQELTGRENIFLNGAILGMRRHEIKRKFDEIVDFADVERFLDTPVKRYSSGMYVRLAFAIAAHLEPDILIVDEVLAVGDAAFQKKCLGKMEEVSKSKGRTVLFVSHNIQAILSLCNRGILLHEGKVRNFSAVETCIQDYMNLIKTYSFNESTAKANRLARTSGKVMISKAIGLQTDGSENKLWSFRYNEPLRFKFECKVNESCNGLAFYMALRAAMSDTIVTNIKTVITPKDLNQGEQIFFNAELPAKQIRPGQYDLYFAIGNKEADVWFDVIDGNINLPAMLILPSSDDVHENMGFFSTDFSITNISIR